MSPAEPIGDFFMTKINKTTASHIAAVIAFDSQIDSFERTQADRFVKDLARLRKGAQAIVAAVEGLSGKARKDKLVEIGAATIAHNSKMRDILAAYKKFAGPDGEAIGRKARAGKLGKCSTIRGAVASHEADSKTKATRQGKSGQGKRKVEFKAKAGGKAPQTLEAKLALIESFCESQGFSFTDFLAEWTEEAEGMAEKKTAAAS